MPAQAGIQPFVLNLEVGGNPFILNATLLWDENDVILVDTGIPGQLELIAHTLAEASFPFEKLTKIIITHHDMDHIGSLPELVKASDGKIQVYAHELGKPFITGEQPTQKRQTLAPPTNVDVTLQDGDVLPLCGGIQVIFTPGHTVDHICLYHIPSKTLITGDALTAENGVLMPPNPPYTPNYPQALESVGKLVDLDIETAIAFHGGVVTDNIRERLIEISKG